MVGGKLESSLVFCDNLERWDGEGKEAQEGGDICVIMTDSRCYMAEPNTMLQSNFQPIKKKSLLPWEVLGPLLVCRSGQNGCQLTASLA